MTGAANPRMQALTDAGVSVWLDDLDRTRIESGELARLISEMCVRGVTTNPTIFDKAISSGATAYAEQIGNLARSGADTDAILRALTTDDVRAACDVFEPVWQATDHIDGRVSIEVEPGLAHDTPGTVTQARELWTTVGRPNAYVKIPATKEGLPAIAAAISEGINVNVTLIFSVERYREVVDAYLTGLEQAVAGGRDISSITSVASFFISRIDTEVDKRLHASEEPTAAGLVGKAAIASGRRAWAAHQNLLATDRWKSLASHGANPQRPLWASTGVKDPAYDPTRYVVDLVVRGCVNTMPSATMDVVAEKGVIPTDSVTGTEEMSEEVWDLLSDVGISESDVSATLESEGVQKFVDSWEQLRSTVAEAAKKAAG